MSDFIESIEYSRFTDIRGSFSEAYNPAIQEHYFPDGIKQISTSTSLRGVIRGFHAQPRMGKMIRVVRGSAYLVSVNIDRHSPLYLDRLVHLLTEYSPRWIYAPSWYARAFIALQDNTIVEYLQTAPHRPDEAVTIAWNDPTIGVDWSYLSNVYQSDFILSEKDQNGTLLSDFTWSW